MHYRVRPETAIGENKGRKVPKLKRRVPKKVPRFVRYVFIGPSLVSLPCRFAITRVRAGKMKPKIAGAIRVARENARIAVSRCADPDTKRALKSIQEAIKALADAISELDATN